jgi:hypothetical protein
MEAKVKFSLFLFCFVIVLLQCEVITCCCVPYLLEWLWLREYVFTFFNLLSLAW